MGDKFGIAISEALEVFMRTKRLNSLGKQRCEGGTEFNFLFFHMI